MPRIFPFRGNLHSGCLYMPFDFASICMCVLECMRNRTYLCILVMLSCSPTVNSTSVNIHCIHHKLSWAYNISRDDYIILQYIKTIFKDYTLSAMSYRILSRIANTTSQFMNWPMLLRVIASLAQRRGKIGIVLYWINQGGVDKVNEELALGGSLIEIQWEAVQVKLFPKHSNSILKAFPRKMKLWILYHMWILHTEIQCDTSGHSQ